MFSPRVCMYIDTNTNTNTTNDKVCVYIYIYIHTQYNYTQHIQIIYSCNNQRASGNSNTSDNTNNTHK